MRPREGAEFDAAASGSPRVVIASDKYKGTLTSVEVAVALAHGLAAAAPRAHIAVVPVADGGDGSLAVTLARGATSVMVWADDVEGVARRVQLSLDGNRAFIEAALICGLGANSPDGPAALRATSRGVGQAILAAVDLGAEQIILAAGGTATSDGGAGMLGALGLRLLDAHGRDIAPGGGGLSELASIDASSLPARVAGVDLILACDVDSPLLGPAGAASLYGPQKGAGPAEVSALERGMARWAGLAVARGMCPESLPGSPGAGAGGGLGFATLLLGGRVVPGADFFLDLTGFDDRVRDAHLVITGEGRLDEQSLCGKAPSVVAARARAAGVPVRAVAGACLLTEEQWRAVGLSAVDTLTDLDPRCAHDPDLSRELLRQVGCRIGSELAAHKFSSAQRDNNRSTSRSS